MGQTYNSTIINAPIKKVWALLRDFHGIGNWASALESVEAVGDAKTDQVGAKRLLNGAIAETLVAIDELAHSVRYTIDEAPGPLAETKSYVGTMTAREITSTGGTFVEIASGWVGNDGAVVEFCNPIYRSFLDGLKATAEK